MQASESRNHTPPAVCYPLPNVHSDCGYKCTPSSVNVFWNSHASVCSLLLMVAAIKPWRLQLGPHHKHIAPTCKRSCIIQSDCNNHQPVTQRFAYLAHEYFMGKQNNVNLRLRIITTQDLDVSEITLNKRGYNISLLRAVYRWRTQWGRTCFMVTVIINVLSVSCALFVYLF